jgi:nucleoside-diphosphate-sugar epimerase
MRQADHDFSVTALRQATVYGPSRRMRFDLAINGMSLSLYNSGVVKLLRDGTQWRPMVHIKDVARAFLAVIEASTAAVNGEIFNVGSEEQNLQLYALSERICRAAGVPHAIEWYGDPDIRSYRVSFRKIVDGLGYRATHTPEDGVREILHDLKQGRLKDSLVAYTVKWYKNLINTRPDILAVQYGSEAHSTVG